MWARSLALAAFFCLVNVLHGKKYSEEKCSSFAEGEVYPERTHTHMWEHSLEVGKPAPGFRGVTAVVNGEFRDVSLSDYAGKYVVIMFYPLDFTFVCPTEITAFSDRVAEFKALNTEVLAVSVDSHFTHLAWIKTPRAEGGLGPVRIPLLSDLTHKMSKDYGVYLTEAGHTLRGLFIIDGKGVLRQITMNDLPVGRSVDETLRLVQAFQYTDKHGEVCPAGWKPGDDTIVPNPNQKLEYFKKHPGRPEEPEKETKKDKTTETKKEKTTKSENSN